MGHEVACCLAGGGHCVGEATALAGTSVVRHLVRFRHAGVIDMERSLRRQVVPCVSGAREWEAHFKTVHGVGLVCQAEMQYADSHGRGDFPVGRPVVLEVPVEETLKVFDVGISIVI